MSQKRQQNSETDCTRGRVPHYKSIWGCAPQGFLLRPNPRNLIRYCHQSPEYMSAVDTQSQNFEEVTKPIRQQWVKGSTAGNENFGPKWPLERGSDLSKVLNTTNILEICSPETGHLLLEKLSSCTFMQHSLPEF